MDAQTLDIKAFYELLGGDHALVLSRLPSEAMIRRFLSKFLGDPSHDALAAALTAGDVATAFRAAHTLKGTSATLGLDRLAAAASALTEALRNASSLPPEPLVAAVNAEYAACIAAIGRLNG